MRDLIIKLEWLNDSKEWLKIVEELEKEVEKQNIILLEWTLEDSTELTEWQFIRDEMRRINHLKELAGKLKDKETREALIADLDRSYKWREDRILWRTNEYKLDTYEVNDKEYTTEDLYRNANWWIECFKHLPVKLSEELKLKEWQVEEIKEAEVQEQIDALASLEADWL